MDNLSTTNENNMVHGGGHCSGGGGGGFSGGGGFRTTVYTTNYYSTPRRHHVGRGGASDDCDCSCFKTCCMAITCVSLKPKTRIKVLWFLVVVITVITGFSVGFGTYGDQSTDTSSSDMRQINNGVSPRFCSGVHVTSNTYPVSVYLLSDYPVVNSDNLTSHIFSKFASLRKETYEYWGFYLLKNSYVIISACSSIYGTDYYLIKGKDNLRKWEDDNYCSSCYESHRNTIECLFGNSTFTHNIYSSDEYYFVVANHLMYSLTVTLTFNLQRTSYDLSSAIHKCKNSFDCSMNYASSDSHESIVIQIPDVDTDNVEVHSTCLRRSGVFVALFLIIPLGIGVCLSAVIYFVCIRKRTKPTSQPYSILQNQSNYNTGAQYSTFSPASDTARNTSPPTYEAASAPPTYEESLKSDKK